MAKVKEHEYDPGKIWGQIGVDYQERVNFERLRKERLERARKAMREHGYDALILLANENIRYVTGTFDLGWKHLLRYCVLPLNSEPILFETVGPDFENTQNNAPWLADRIRPAMVWKGAWSAEDYMASRFAEGIKSALKEEGVENGKIGADLLDLASGKALAKAGVNPESASRLMEGARLIKTKDELELLKQTCFLVDCVYDKLRRSWVRPGVKEIELKGKIANFLLKNNCSTYAGNVSSGTNGNPYFRGGGSDKMLGHGELVIFDIIPQFMGYWADYARTFPVGAAPTQAQRKLYKECYDLLYDAMSAVKPGATSKDVAERFVENEESRYKTPSLIQGGHSVGLRDQEGFWITKAYSIEHPEKIEKNMYLAIETYAARKGENYGVRLEENFVVTEGGIEVFSGFPFEEDMLT